MTIREFFDAMYAESNWNETAEFEQTIFNCMKEDYNDFESWAIENGIDLKAEENGVLVLAQWAWDMCGD